jgi:hypothetical protein
MDGLASGPLALRGDVVATVLEDGALLLDLDTKYFFLLNHSAWAVVQLFEAGTTAGHAHDVCVAAGADGGEVDGLVSLLLSEGVIEPAAADARPALELSAPWAPPSVEKQDEPLQRVIVNAFDPTIPLAE